VASPAVLLLATVALSEVQVTELVRFCVLVSLNVPVAVNCWVVPLGIEGLAGVTAMDTSVATVTVSVVEPVTLPEVAWMVALPVPAAVASPAVLLLATVVLSEVQVTELVRFCVLVSLNVPVAVNCCVVPLGIEGLTGVTAMDTSVATVTVSVVEPVTLPEVAWMVALPVPAAEASPAVLLLATVALSEVQVTELVRFCVLVSLNVPVAVNCWVVPLGIEGLAGVTAMDTSVAAVTVSVVEPVTLPCIAEMVVVPGFRADARPAEPIVAAAVFDELQLTALVRFCVELSL